MQQRSINSKRILIVDDDEGAVFGYARYLSQSGFATESAADLAEALGKLSIGKFDAVIFDVRLPDGSSIDILHKVRDTRSSIKIFVVSGLTDPAVRAAALAAGADKFLVKPLSIEELCKEITGAFEAAS